MKKSLSYYLTLLVIRLKGVKKTFSKDPIDYLKLRKEDIHFPGSRFFRAHPDSSTFTVQKTMVTELCSRKNSAKLILFVHGGAFVYGPVKHHWDTVKQIAGKTGFTVWMCDYPKAPEHKISEIARNIDAVYSKALEKFRSDDILCVGDSAGATLLITLVQQLVKKNKELPAKLLLISPVIDAALKNPEIALIDKKDPILSKKGVLSAKLMCAENQNLSDPLLSPIEGSVEMFPETILFLAENDITYPDQQLFAKKLQKANIRYKVVFGKDMPHIWPLLPVMKEAKQALKSMIALIKQ